MTLDIGEIHLDLLGLVVDLAPVNLDITAVPEAGNLLGNLLCAVAHRLDSGGPLQGIVALLNRLLGGRALNSIVIGDRNKVGPGPRGGRSDGSLAQSQTNSTDAATPATTPVAVPVITSMISGAPAMAAHR